MQNNLCNNDHSVLELGMMMIGCNNICITSQRRKFRAFFGSHVAAAACWILMKEHYPTLDLFKKNMLLALYYSKKNPTNDVAAQFLECHVQTYTSIRDYYVELICHLSVVSFHLFSLKIDVYLVFLISECIHSIYNVLLYRLIGRKGKLV